MKTLIERLQFQDILACLRANGMSHTWKLYKWRFVVAIFIVYLIRDILIYVLLPYWLLIR